MKIDGVHYTAKLVVGSKNGESYYDHSLTEIEKTVSLALLTAQKRTFQEMRLLISRAKIRDWFQLSKQTHRKLLTRTASRKWYTMARQTSIHRIAI